MGPSNVTFELLAPHHISGVQALFERLDCPCYCQYYGFAGDHREWQNRCSNERTLSRDALGVGIENGAYEASVAIAGELVVGWARTETPEKLTKLYQNRLYRGLPALSGSRSGVHAVSCFLIDREFRRQGVAQGLLVTLIERLRAQGARRIEAFPRGAADVSDEEQFMGPLSLYENLGFQLVHDFAPYPILALDFFSEK